MREMSDPDAPWHAHIYYDGGERDAARALHARLAAMVGSATPILFVGRMTDRAAGPHPIPQFEIHFPARARAKVVSAIDATGLRALVHPLTDDDLADHTSLANWIGEPLDLDIGVLDPPGVNQGIPRFGKSDH